MSLYNMLHGVNPAAGTLLSMLEIKPDEVERLRDVHIFKPEEGEELQIAIFTRTGGGNREDYPNELIKSHPEYIRDYDDDFDCTYATYLFRVSAPMQAVLRTLVDSGVDTTPPMEKMTGLIEKLKSGDPDDAEVKKAMEVGKGIFEKLEAPPRCGECAACKQNDPCLDPPAVNIIEV